MNKAANYFALWNPGYFGAPTEGAGGFWSRMWVTNLVLYFGVVIGVAGQVWLGEQSQISSWSEITSIAMARNLLIAAVILPVIWKSADLHRRKPKFIHFFLCVQHGYFWPSIISQLSTSLSQTA